MYLGEKITFSAQHKQLLQQQQITETAPGPIVHDFTALVEYVRATPAPVTATQQLPLRALAEINARLYRPIPLGLKRPQQKSYPLIHGLYLLLRASGLTYLDTTRAKPHLCVDEAMYAVWQTLNPVEQYCTLLEIWLLRGYAEIVGERSRPFGLPDNFSNWLDFFHRLARPERAANLQDLLSYLPYTPGWHNLGLLELFGCVAIESAAPIAGQGWQIARIASTPLGEALLALLNTTFFADFDRLLDLESAGKIPPGVLQPVLQPYFPQWERTLPFPEEMAFREGAHIFKVTLWKDVWRRVVIPATATLDELALLILRAYAFDSDHLYRFTYQNRFGVYVHINHGYMDEGPWADETQVGAVPLAVGQALTFLFDFGDHWEFEVLLEAVDAAARPEPQVLESEGAAPPQYGEWEDEDDEEAWE